jgi:hypothetical protein
MASEHGISDQAPTLWLIAHESEDPMRLVMRELERDSAPAELERVLRGHRDNGFRIDPRDSEPQPEVRYQVFNDTGWVATYWLSTSATEDQGMLTLVATPQTQNKTHVRIPLSR